MNNEQIIKDTAEYNFNLGFQKGKLEQKKEDVAKWDKGYEQGYEMGKLEERERVSFEVKRLIVDIKKHWDKVVNPKENVLRGLEQLQKEIGGMK